MTSSMLKSVFRYVLDKDQYFGLETVFAQSCFPNKDNIVEGELNNLFHLMTKMIKDGLMIRQGKF